jgi:hypothetical protein
MFPRLIISNREKFIVAVLALILWVSWLVRYDVQLRGAQGPAVFVLLDRWTGTVYWSVGGDQWKEVQNTQAKHAAAPDWTKDEPKAKLPEKDDWESIGPAKSGGAFSDLIPPAKGPWPKRLSDIEEKAPDWAKSKTPAKAPWEQYQPKP